jgi:hypothetical protein
MNGRAVVQLTPVGSGTEPETPEETSRPERPPDVAGGPVGGVPMDTMYEVLRNERRRLVLHYLVSTPDHRAVLGPLATQVAAWENDVPVPAVTSELRKRTYNTLQQTHLPKMDESGLIAYDHHSGTVELTVSPLQLEVFLVALPKTGSVWTKGFLLAGVVLWLLLAANWLAVHVFQLYRPGSAVLVSGMALCLVLVGFLHVYRTLR